MFTGQDLSGVCVVRKGGILRGGREGEREGGGGRNGELYFSTGERVFGCCE